MSPTSYRTAPPRDEKCILKYIGAIVKKIIKIRLPCVLQGLSVT